MELIYKTVKSMDRPSEIEFGDGVVYLRKDITSEDVDYGDSTAVKWIYQEACLTMDEYKEYIPYMVARLAIGQENGDNNQLAIMEALADLYEAIANVM